MASNREGNGQGCRRARKARVCVNTAGRAGGKWVAYRTKEKGTMNLFDFLYSLLKDYHINGLYLIILLYIIIVPFWPFLFFLICRIKTLKIDKSELLINTQAVEWYFCL
jgi:hypothetical protein